MKTFFAIIAFCSLSYAPSTFACGEEANSPLINMTCQGLNDKSLTIELVYDWHACNEIELGTIKVAGKAKAEYRWSGFDTVRDVILQYHLANNGLLIEMRGAPIATKPVATLVLEPNVKFNSSGIDWKGSTVSLNGYTGELFFADENDSFPIHCQETAQKHN